MADLPTIKGMPRGTQIALIVAAGVVVFVLIVDKLLMPALVHSQSVLVVPNVVGRPSAEAIHDLTARGFPIEKIDTHADERFAAGTVLYQSPYAGAEVKEGRKLFLTVSSGRELLSIPDVAGLPLREAKIRLQMTGLTIGDVTYENNSTLPDETVIRQSSSPGSRLAMGAAMSLVVSSGPEQQAIVVPSLTGKTLAEAQTALQSVKLVFGTITYKTNRGVLPTTVLDQQPAAGDTVKEGSAVHLIVAGE